MILKIQRPLGGDMTAVLVYNEDHSVQGHWPYTPELAELFGAHPRVYVHGVITLADTLVIESVIGHEKLF